MADLLGLSPLTVENLKRRVYAKLGVNSSTQAVSRAASLGMLDESAGPPSRQPTANGDAFPVLTVVSGQPCPALDQVVVALIASGLPFVLIPRHGPVAGAHWTRYHRGPILAALVNPRRPTGSWSKNSACRRSWCTADRLIHPNSPGR